MKAIQLISIFVFATVVLSVSPGIKITLTQKGLEYAKNTGIQILLSKISTINVPDESGSAKVPVIGHIDWDIKNIKLGSIKFPSNTVNPVANKGLHLRIASASAAATADWHYREHSWPHIKGHGSVDVSLDGITLDVVIGFGDKNGEPTCSVVSESISIGHIDIKVHGGASWLYNFLLGLFKGKIKDALQGGLEKAVTDGISNSLNEALMKIPMRQKIQDLVVIDYSLTDAIRFTNDYLVIDGKGEFYDLKNPTEAPFSAHDLPDLVSDRMLQVAISDYLPDTAGYAFWKAGALTFDITSKDIPSSSPLQFNTDSFKYIIPELYNKYPGKNISAHITPADCPTGVFSGQGAIVNAKMDIDMFVMDPGQVPVFTLEVDIEADGKALVKDKLIYGNITDAKFTLKLTKSEIGNFDVTDLDSFAEFLFEGVIIPFVNTIVNKGIEIPTIPNIDFVSPTISYGPDYIIVATDVKYTVGIDTCDCNC